MGIKFANSAYATLASGINSSATSITLTTGQGARFPTLSGGDFFYATLIDTSNNLEIIKCTARSTDVLTVVRGQESTTARAYSTGDRIELRVTAAGFSEMLQTSNNLSELTATASTARSNIAAAGTGVAQTFTASQRGTVTTDNDGSFDMNVTNNFKCTPTGSITLTFTNITSGQTGNILLVNGSNYTVSAHANTKVGTGVLAALSATGTYWVSYYSDGTNVYVSATGALS
jgi:hypothetical protein